MEIVLWIVGVLVGIIALVLIVDQICNLINHNKKCFMCWGSKNCTKCVFCIKSDSCLECEKCIRCKKCEFCESCVDCTKCSDCIYCTECKECSWCEGCQKCKKSNYCLACDDCFKCEDCRDCIECREIRNIKAKRQLGYICGGNCSKCKNKNRICKYVPYVRAEKLIEKY